MLGDPFTPLLGAAARAALNCPAAKEAGKKGPPSHKDKLPQTR